MSVRFLGHPIHPMLIVFPLGLLPTSVLFDIIYLSSENTRWATISFWLIPVGVLGGLVAAGFGLADWIDIAPRTRAKRIGAIHGVGNVLVILLFVLSWLLRLSVPEVPPLSAMVLSFAGVALSLLTGWLGGELVDQLGVGVSSAANSNSPSSLRHGRVDREVPILRDSPVAFYANEGSEADEIVVRGKRERDALREPGPPPPP